MAALVEYFLHTLTQTMDKITQRPTDLDFIDTYYMPVQKEVYEQDLKVIGQIPIELNGAYMRNGPNNRNFMEGKNHLFQGEGMIHSIRFKDGKIIAYNNHFVRSDIYKNNQRWGHDTSPKFTNLRGPTWAFMIYQLIDKLRWAIGINKSSKPKEVEGISAQGNINIQYIAGKLLALHEADIPFQVRLLCNGLLETIGYIKVGENKKITAHPHTDQDTNETFYQSYYLNDACFTYSYIDSKGYTQKPIRIDLRYPVMSHDMSMTKKYAIFMELPLQQDFKTMLKDNVLPYQFKKDQPSRFGLLPRYAKNQDEIVWFTLPSQFIFHVGNSWDVEGRNAVKMYACRYDDFSLEEGLVGLTKTKNEKDSAFLCEYTFDLDTKTAEEKILSNEQCEFPQVNQRYFGKPCKYIYTTYQQKYSDVPHQGGFVKYDISNPQALKKEIVDFGNNRFGGEMYYAPKSEDEKVQEQSDEDDGYLMGYVHDYNTQKSSFVIYDAQLKTKKPLAEVILPQRVPFGFHGSFFNSKQLQIQQDQLGHIEESPY